MVVLETAIPGVRILEPKVFDDERGFFFESYNAQALRALGLDDRFVQDNHSRSRRGVLRGLHYQIEHGQAKLVRVVVGEVFDVAVDLRRSSHAFGRWVGVVLSAANRRQVYIPSGCAHGFLTLSDWAEVLYKTTDFYAPQHERCIRWDAPELAIDWPLSGTPLLSDKDLRGLALADADLFP